PLELRLRELAQLADRLGHLRTVRRRKLDHLIVLVLVLLPQADVAALGDENLDVRLSFDAHARYLLAEPHRSARARTARRRAGVPGGGIRRARRAVRSEHDPDFARPW